ncbi:hypothetical protein ScalyP_jg3688 [Parmales sp. scaly parma]|nr:hypothetical protein ScalyP_jg3688 [Parmales sp. scaly parma]
MPTNNTLAIPISLVGNVINSIGYVLWKVAHNQVEAAKLNPLPNKQQQCCACIPPSPHFLRTPTWYIGFFLYTLGSSLHGFSLSLGTLTIIAPLDSVTLVANAILAPLVLKEKTDIWKVSGTITIIFGIIVLTESSPASPGDFEPLDTFGYIGQGKCVGVGGSWGLVCVGLYLVERVYYRKNKVDKDKEEDKDEDKNKPRPAAQLLIVCTLAAFFASICQLMLKSLFTLLSTPSTSLSSPVFYLTLLIFLTTDVAMEMFRQRALREFDAIFVVPVISSLLLTGSVILGGFCFNEFDAMSGGEGASLMAAVGLIFFGVCVLAGKEMQQQRRVGLVST